MELIIILSLLAGLACLFVVAPRERREGFPVSLLRGSRSLHARAFS